MKIIVLGSGTSTGVPSLCCDCEVCQSEDPFNKRLRASILIQSNGANFLVDTSTDLRQQCLRYKITHIEAVLYTHHHADHVHGIDELRCFNFFNKAAIPCYGNEVTLSMIKKNFGYIFNGNRPEGGGIPQLILNTIENKPFEVEGTHITPVPINHGSLTILGYRIGNAAYITDGSGVPNESKNLLMGLDILIINSVGFKPHPTHFCLPEALEVVSDLKPKRTFLTHINHTYDHKTVSKKLPGNVELAYDGLEIEC